MTTSSALALACVGSLVLAVVLAVIGFRALGRARGVRRVQVPARLLSTSPSPGGDLVEVEYPAPDGTTLRTRMQVFRVHAPGQPYIFDGTVWVDPARPTDATPRRQGRTSGAVTTLVLAGVALLAALGTGIGSVVVRFAESLPS
ncbi:hypothetical protein [Cellulomonas phragmiteti]|uniref:hypothetical protein n=1 Tax=Cellulomonas phragmiteti TaxID=478780 RepID=UPI001940C235|nr:hypothetical protein [Cellulomonas phragmiteti]